MDTKEVKNNRLITIKDNTANPAPLGLMGFGMTTVLLNLHNSGVFDLESMILSMGIFYGGLAQIIAGVMEWKKGNTFGTLAFISYGFFWLSLVAIIVFPAQGWAKSPDNLAMISYLTMWGIFTGVLFIMTLRLSKSLQIVFATLTLLFFLLAIGDYSGSTVVKHFAGYEGILCGFSAIYAGLGQTINEVFDKTVIPL